jgi:ACS family D-galactonate transporter-like MFS transporter
VWLIAWTAFATQTPAEYPKISQEELQYIESNLARRQEQNFSPWAVAKERQVLLLSLSYLLLINGLWMIVLWLPTYMAKVRRFTLQQMGWVGIISTFASFVGLVRGGTLSDLLLHRGYSVRFARA